MRVLLINYEYPPLGGGAGNATAHIAREMARLGHDVLVLTSAFGDFPRRESVDGYAIRRIPTIRRHEEKCASWEMAVFMASACVFAPAAALGFKPDACVAFFGVPSGPSAWMVKALTGTPYVVSLRGGDVPGFQPYDLARMHALTGPLIRFLWRRAFAVVPNSGGLAELARAFEPGMDFPVIPNGADTGLFHPRASAPQGAREGQGGDGPVPGDPGGSPQEPKPGPVRLFFHGRVVYQKGLDTVLSALGMLPDTSPWELHIVGDGPERPALENQARELGIGRKVIFRGWMHRPQLAQVLRDMDVFVFASRDEGMPNAVLEAMASGLPVVATSIAGSEELVIPEETGLLVEPASPGGLCQALARLIGTGCAASGAPGTSGADAPAVNSKSDSAREAQALRERMGRAGRERVLRHYSWASVAERYLDLFAGMAAKKRRP